MSRRPTSRLRLSPHYLIIGGQKAGTTSLQAYLEASDGIRRPMMKEIHYFDHNVECGPQWYRSHFPLSSSDRRWITGESSPYYLLHPHVPRRVAEELPDVRLIAILRNPMNRALSHFHHSRHWGGEPVADFARALELESERTDTAWEALVATGRRQPPVEWFSYVRRGLYADQLDRWLEYFPKESLLLLTSDELFGNPFEVVNRTRAHLGLSEVVRSPRYEPRNARDYSPMPRELMLALRARFRGDIERVEAMLGRSTGWLADEPQGRSAGHRDHEY